MLMLRIADIFQQFSETVWILLSVAEVSRQVELLDQLPQVRLGVDLAHHINKTFYGLCLATIGSSDRQDILSDLLCD